MNLNTTQTSTSVHEIKSGTKLLGNSYPTKERDILEFKLYKDIKVIKCPSNPRKNHLVKSNYTVKNTT